MLVAPLTVASVVLLAASSHFKNQCVRVFNTLLQQVEQGSATDRALINIWYAAMAIAVVFALISAIRPRLADYEPVESSPVPLFTQNRIMVWGLTVAAVLSLAAYNFTREWGYCGVADGRPTDYLLPACGACALLFALSARNHRRAGNAFRLRDPELFVPWAIANRSGQTGHAQVSAQLQAARTYVATLKQNNVTAGLSEAEASVVALEEKLRAATQPPSRDGLSKIQQDLAAKRQSLAVLRQNRAPSPAVDAVLADIRKLRGELSVVGAVFGAPGTQA